ncbi:MAG: hypothetical protein LBT48_06790 [Prevotellaceae bacterium]|jgi:hypothetical protein|nr:hypothetical protein [Prevotellaceae bacterium]
MKNQCLLDIRAGGSKKPFCPPICLHPLPIFKYVHLIHAGLWLTVAMFFASCNPDDPAGEGRNSVKLVSRIEIYEYEYEVLIEKYTRIYEFDYDAQNRMARFARNDLTSQAFAAITYPTSSTIAISNGAVCTLNGDGNVVSTNNSDEYWIYENGYLAKYVYSGLYGESDKNIAIESYTWENGNLAALKTEYKTTNDSDWERIERIEYSTISNKPCSIDLLPLIVSGGIVNPIGWYGKSSKNLPNKMDKWSNGDMTFYRYETNADGYVEKIYVKEYYANAEVLRAVIFYK